MPELDATSLTIIFLAIAFGSAVKGMTGFGMPLIAVPVIAPILGLDHALAVMVLPSLASNVWIIWAQRKHKPEAGIIAPVVMGSFLTIALGVWVLTLVPQQYLLAFMGVWLLAYIAWHFLRKNKTLTLKRQRLLGVVIGLAAGFTQGTTGITTPFVVTYLHALKLPPRTYTYANAAIYQFFWIVQGLLLWAFGLFDLERLTQGVLALIPMGIFLPLGIYFTGRVKHGVFEKIIIGLMVILSARLFWAAVQ